MIKNEKQYKISKKYLAQIKTQIKEISEDKTQNPLRNQLILASLTNAKSEVEKELMTYESLKGDRKYILKERTIGDLPLLLIEYKIMSGLTQKEFSSKLGLKEQQLQRYEADNFKSVTFKNLLKFIHILGLEIKIKETHIPVPSSTK
jgi:DNA-binding Xre family transcriptional regulator